jgi:hypothetical protein
MAEPKRPGRPPLDASGAPSAPVCLKLRASDYDRIDRLARQQRKSIQEVIRHGLRHLLTDQRGA